MFSNEDDGVDDGVKLKLKGKGSGVLEGPNNEESDESLSLTVSSKNYEKYNAACNLV